MTLADVKDYLKNRIICPNWYVGKRDKDKEQSITVYPTQGPVPRIPIGGLEQSRYGTKVASVLVHWGKSYTPAEQKAQEVYDCLFGQAGVIGGKEVIMFDMRTSEPVGLGTDGKGYYEFVINFVVYYRKG
ncbi:minor capsid protein [Extibacter muris]|uniref:DUF3168 domain-containing protein n=1 Tax=Extibacter muris TaxID=1796622 RepID=A0A4R4FGF4_9FIRM|nr:minor capsid protein [Extibacter muris]MCU0079338.1 minor capsid protein [Extibacter muris]TDA21939.1 hypothetical protein E1963_09265 [Extibacter muris]